MAQAWYAFIARSEQQCVKGRAVHHSSPWNRISSLLIEQWHFVRSSIPDLQNELYESALDS